MEKLKEPLWQIIAGTGAVSSEGRWRGQRLGGGLSRAPPLTFIQGELLGRGLGRHLPDQGKVDR